MATECRVRRVASELKKFISLLLCTKIKNTTLSKVTITEIDLSKDLSYVKIYYTSLIDEGKDIEYINKEFEKSKGFFRSAIAKSLTLRIVPNLKFIYDTSLEYGVQMEEKINQAIQSDSKIINQSMELLEKNYKQKYKNTKTEKLR